MSENEMKPQIKVELFLDEDIVEWIDNLKGQIGLRSRGDLVNRLLGEIRGEQSDPEITT